MSYSTRPQTLAPTIDRPRTEPQNKFFRQRSTESKYLRNRFFRQALECQDAWELAA